MLVSCMLVYFLVTGNLWMPTVSEGEKCFMTPCTQEGKVILFVLSV